MKRIYLDFKVTNIKIIEEVRLSRASDGTVQTMRVMPISADIVESAVKSALERAAAQKSITATSQLYICTIRDDQPAEKRADGTLEERVVFGICIASEPATVEVIEPHFVKPYNVRQG